MVWKSPDGTSVAVSDTINYVVSQGTVDAYGIQLAELTIKAAKLADFAAESSFTYKCSVTSSQYADSPASSDVNVVAKVLELGKIQTNINNTYTFCPDQRSNEEYFSIASNY